MRAPLRVAVMLLVLAAVGLGCNIDFDPPSEIQSLRFLGVIADPIEAAPNETTTFTAIVTNANGTVYEGPVAWLIVGGDQLRETGEGDFSVDDLFLQLSPETPFAWAVPSRDEMTARFGPPQENGWLLTVAASAFKNGDIEDEPKTAFKLFVVSERDVDQRFENPVLQEVRVKAGGDPLPPDAEGQYVTQRNRVNLRAIVDQTSGDQTFHWYATTNDFEPDLDAEQTLDPGSNGTYRLFCVVRESFFFVHDDNSLTRVTGQDAWQGTVLFE